MAPRRYGPSGGAGALGSPGVSETDVSDTVAKADDVLPALAVALRELPGNVDILTELVSALERESRHREAVA